MYRRVSRREMSDDGLFPRVDWCHPSLSPREVCLLQSMAPGHSQEVSFGPAGRSCSTLGL